MKHCLAKCYKSSYKYSCAFVLEAFNHFFTKKGMGGRGEEEMTVSSLPKSPRQQRRQTCARVLYRIDSTNPRNVQIKEFFSGRFLIF